MSENHYSTDHELHFLAKLGSYHEPALGSKRTLLHQYLAAMALRTDWERIDRGTITAQVVRMIKEVS